MFRIEFTSDAYDDLDSFRKFDQRRILEEIEAQLTHEPTRETRKRKRLRSNPLADWELRVETFRVFFTVDEADGVVAVIAIGYKEGNDLYVHGERYEL